MASHLKSILKSDRARRVACTIAATFMAIVRRTNLWQVIGGETPNQYWDEGRPFIIAFWHNRLMMMPYCWRKGVPMNMLISQHRDGELISNTIAHVGIGSIRGSSSRDGAQALRAMVKALKKGEYVGITPDGPRGPRMHATDGVISVARLAGVPIFPVTVATSRRRMLRSWDHFLVALPFGRGVFIWGDPIEVPRGASAEEQAALRQHVENEMTRISDQADEICGYPGIKPAVVTTDDGSGETVDWEKRPGGAA